MLAPTSERVIHRLEDGLVTDRQKVAFGAEMMRKPEEIPECSHFRLALRYGK